MYHIQKFEDVVCVVFRNSATCYDPNCYDYFMRQLTNHIYCMNADARTDQPFVYYIKGCRFSLLVDAGNSPENYRRLLSKLEEAGLPEPDLAVLTHWHWDHTFGVCAAECPVIASEETARILTRVQTWKWDDVSMRKRLETGEDIPFTYECMKAQYSDTEKIKVKLPDITFETDMKINLGDVTCILHHRDSPHTRDAVMILVRDDDVLIGGDAHYEDYYDNDSRYDRRRLADFIQYLREESFSLYFKGHDEPGIGKDELLMFLTDELKNAV